MKFERLIDTQFGPKGSTIELSEMLSEEIALMRLTRNLPPAARIALDREFAERLENGTWGDIVAH